MSVTQIINLRPFIGRTTALECGLFLSDYKLSKLGAENYAENYNLLFFLLSNTIYLRFPSFKLSRAHT